MIMLKDRLQPITWLRWLAALLLGTMLLPPAASAEQFVAPLPKSTTAESVLFSLKTRSQEFVFFESLSPFVIRFSRIDHQTGALLDQPLLELPEFQGSSSFSSVSRARATALSDGGFVIAQSYSQPFFGPASTRFSRVDAHGQLVSSRTVWGATWAGILQSGPDEVTILEYWNSTQMGFRVDLSPNNLPVMPVSSAQVCTEPVNLCRWQLAGQPQIRSFDVPAEALILRTRRSSFELEQLELLRVDLAGNVLSSIALGALPSGSYASVQQFDQGVLLSISDATTRTLSFYDFAGQMLWRFSQPGSLNLLQHSADALGLSANISSQGNQRIVRYDGAGTLQWSTDANLARALRFHSNGSIALQSSEGIGPGSWQWFRRDGRLLGLPEGVRSFAFAADGSALAVAPDSANPKGARFLRFNAQGALSLVQRMQGANVSPFDRTSQFRLLPNEHGVDIAYVESNRLQLWRYSPSGSATTNLQIEQYPYYNVTVDSIDRLYVTTFENTLLALGPQAVRLWETGLFGVSPNAVIPLDGGVLVAGFGAARAYLRTLNSAGEVVANLEVTSAEDGSELRCRKLEQIAAPVQNDLANCFHRAAPGAPIALYVVDRALRLQQTGLIFSAAQVSDLTDDGGALLSESDAFGNPTRYLRVNRLGQQLWQLQMPTGQYSALVPTRSGGAWLREFNDTRPLRYVDAAGVIHVSTLLANGVTTALADDSLLLVTASQITRVQFLAGQFVASQLLIEPTRKIVGEIRVNGLRSAWLEKTNDVREYSLRMFDWPAAPALGKVKQ